MPTMKQWIRFQCVSLLLHAFLPIDAWTSSSDSLRRFRPPFTRQPSHSFAPLTAKRRKQRDDDDLFDWYDSVDADATPDDIFWQEVERQRLSSRVAPKGSANGETRTPTWTSAAKGPSVEEDTEPVYAAAPEPSMPPAAAENKATPTLASGTPMTVSVASTFAAPVKTKQFSKRRKEQQGQDNIRSVDSILAEFAAFAVADNWIDDDLRNQLIPLNETEQEILETAQRLQAESKMNDIDSIAYMTTTNDPWSEFGLTPDQIENNRIVIDPSKEQEIWYDPEVDDGVEAARIEEEFRARLAKIKATSPSLERARGNPTAKAFFEREPNAIAGCNRMWVSAVDNACFGSLRGALGNYGVEFACNFGDFEDGCLEDGLVSIEEMASYKARQVYEVTGLPCIASRTAFEIEPVPNFDIGRRPSNPRVASGYRFNDVGMHVDTICDALRPLSDRVRTTQFRTCMCFYDGQMEFYDYGILDCDIQFCHSLRTYIPTNLAQDQMIKTLEMTFGLEYMPWLTSHYNDESSLAEVGAAAIRLRDRVLKDGKVLPNNIIDVSSFMDSMVDVDLMEDCAKELADRCVDLRPNKILTVATTGLVLALPMGKHMCVGVVYARKERNVVMADTYQATYSSKTVGKKRELLVAKNHLNPGDRVLIVDDFLSTGSSQEALLRIVSESGAKAVGVAVLLEKVYECGRQYLSGYNVPVFSVCRVASLEGGVIRMLEEEGYEPADAIEVNDNRSL